MNSIILNQTIPTQKHQNNTKNRYMGEKWKKKYKNLSKKYYRLIKQVLVGLIIFSASIYYLLFYPWLSLVIGPIAANVLAIIIVPLIAQYSSKLSKHLADRILNLEEDPPITFINLIDDSKNLIEDIQINLEHLNKNKMETNFRTPTEELALQLELDKLDEQE